VRASVLFRSRVSRASILLFVSLLPGLSCAEESKINSGDTAWLLVATGLVLMMSIPGLAMFYGGLVRTKNALSIFIQCFAIVAVVSFLWIFAGYSLVFTDGHIAQQWIGGLSKQSLIGVTSSSISGTIPEYLFVVFQLTFAAITPALVIGGFAERIRFSVVLWFSALWLLLVYVPVAHWVWGGGWLAKLGVMDYAGGLVVHVTAGTAAIVCAIVVKQRRGFPEVSMPPHNLPLTAAGAGLLWFGWYGFNGGSALAANGSAASALLATHMGASAGALSWMTVEWIKYRKPSVLGILTGMVAGLGTITPAAGFVSPIGATCIGLIAGTVCFFATQFVKRVLRIDDSLDVSPVHGVGGAIGTIMTGIFAGTQLGGAGYTVQSTMSGQLGIQLVGVLSVGAWCVFVTWILLRILDAILGLRVNEEQETEGLDVAEHGERGYGI